MTWSGSFYDPNLYHSFASLRRHFTFAGVTFKAIQFHSSIGMAALAKSLVAAKYAVSLGAGMTFNTFCQAMLLPTYAFVHGLISLVLEKIHMDFAH
jgi:hypothetical protein